ncbi:MAG: chromosome segregation protein SMC, partial [Clostridiaceae bacterium]|nr:chromosome segregation protein SMC [Clostridiaceae bacterium]
QLDREKDSSEEDRLTGLVRGGSGAKERLVAQLQEITEKIAETESRRHDAEESLAESSKAMDTISGYLTKLGQEQGRLEQRLENAGNQLMDQRARLWEEYSCTFANREEWYRTDLDQVKVREEVKSLRQQIRDLGAVNVQAIEESRELNERFAFMEQQKADIVSAQKDLAKIIADIKDGMYKQFKDSFQFINEQFRVVFRELFGGGEAELVLEDRSDILNSPIDIKVMPPGKRLQNMLALSGGERCLTAIALLFAIQKLNPSPFCVLDEVEAALDESNIFRFTDYIKANSSATQYILVTHRRGTMESARMMYGVTMQERGVSQVISIRLDE